jgi:hypothetical protein
MQPFWSAITFSSALETRWCSFMRLASTLILKGNNYYLIGRRNYTRNTYDPMSFTITAIRRPCSLRRMCWSRVVLPLPYVSEGQSFQLLRSKIHSIVKINSTRNPERRVTGSGLIRPEDMSMAESFLAALCSGLAMLFVLAKPATPPTARWVFAVPLAI